MSHEINEWIDQSIFNLRDQIKHSLEERFPQIAASRDYQGAIKAARVLDPDSDFDARLLEASSRVQEIVCQTLTELGLDGVHLAGSQPQVELKEIPEVSLPLEEKSEPVLEVVHKSVNRPTRELVVDGGSPISRIAEMGSTDLMVTILDSLLAAQTRDQKRLVFVSGMNALAQAANSGQITPRAFSRKVNILIGHDRSHDHQLIAGILHDLSESEDKDEIKLYEILQQFLSTTTMERILFRPDLDICKPDRMAVYIRNEAGKSLNNMWSTFQDAAEERDDSDDDFTFQNWKRGGDLSELERLLQNAVDRDSDEEGFLEEVVLRLRAENCLGVRGKKPEIEYVQDAIELLAKRGSEAAEAFLSSTWLDRNITTYESD